MEILYFYSSNRTGFSALHAGYAGGFASRSGGSSLVAVTAHNHSLFFKRHNGNEVLWAGFYAHSAAFAFCGIYSCHIVLNSYCVVFADIYAVAEAYTAVGAVFVPP